MAMFINYQNKLTQLHDNLINAEGFGKAAETCPAIKAHLDCRLKGSKGWVPEHFIHFTPVLTVSAEGLEDVFSVANGVPVDGARIETVLDTWSSLSVGDLVEVDGVYHMVDGFGFKEVAVQ
jgi:hypothetical protein